MKLNHVNLTVTDVGPAHDFLVKHFGLRSPHGVKPNAPLAVLFDDDGLVLTLIRAAAGTDVTYPPSFHVGFIQPSPERVNEIHQRLRADGIEAEAPHRAHGAWTFYFSPRVGSRSRCCADGLTARGETFPLKWEGRRWRGGA